MGQNRVIGCDNKMPWHLPEDFKFFKQQTMGHILVMGRKTYESIGRPLPGRETIVLSRTTKTIKGVHVISSLATLEELGINKTIYICGGSEIYKQALPLCSELFLTCVKKSPEGDAFFPPFEKLFTQESTLLETDDFTVNHYSKI